MCHLFTVQIENSAGRVITTFRLHFFHEITSHDDVGFHPKFSMYKVHLQKMDTRACAVCH